jgi:nonribosomal peptide synthetase DhbF
MTNTIHGTFAAVARAVPNHPAIVSGERTVSYAELHRWGLTVAAGLRDAVVPDEPVGLCAGRSPGTIAGMLGILEAGGAYLPLDPRLPDARLRYMIEDSGMRRILSDAAHADRVRALAPTRTEVTVITDGPASAPVPPAGPADGSHLAYVLYTSGSTGRPKGVLIEHHSVLALARNPFFAVTGNDVFLQLTPMHADPAVFETWCPLLNGAVVVLPPAGELSVHEIGAEVVRRGVTVLRLVAPLFKLMVETNLAALTGLRLLISGGDRAAEAAVRTALTKLPGCTVVNGYGPTESTVYACCHAMRDYDENWPSVPIGRPIDGVTARVLAEDLRPAESGELYLGGVGLARGYLHRPELDRERFVVHPASGERLYRTGDRVRLLPDGNLEFRGRIDDQVKIRGFRVELGEIEKALAEHEAVDEAVVVTGRPNHLAAYVRRRHPVPAARLRAHLAERLPDYMVPSVVEPVGAFPTLPGGKIDRAALAAGGGEPVPGRAPATQIERRLAAIWAEVLGRSRVGLDDSFFDLGGQSLAAMEIVARVAKSFGVRLPLAAIFEAPTLGAFADRVGAADGDRPDQPGRGADRAPLRPAQEGVWYDDQLGAAGRYTISRTFQLDGPLDAGALRSALDALADRQRVLKSVVKRDRDGLWLVVRDDRRPALRVVDLAALPAAEREARAHVLVTEAATRRLDPSTGPLVRVLLVALGAERWVVHFDLHHIIADDWSLDIFFAELTALYAAECLGRPAELPPLESQYADHAAWDGALRGDSVSEALSAWRQMLRGYPGVIELPTDFPRSDAPGDPGGAGDRVRVELDAELSAAVANLSRHHRVSRFMVALAAVYVVLSRYAGQQDICVGTPVAGRTRPDSANLIGYFVNMLAVRINPAEQSTVPELLAHIRDVCLGIYRHEDVSFHTLAREFDLLGEAGRFSPFQVVVAYQQRPAQPLRLPGVTVTPRDAGTTTSAKFDLGFGFEEHGDTIGVDIEFSADLFRRETAERMGQHLINVFRGLATHPTGTVGELDMLSAAEEHLIRVEWNRTERDFPLDRCLHELISERARERLDEPAVVGPDETLTYRQLAERSDRLAGLLVRHGVRLEDRVAVCLDRSAGLIVALLGVLKAGGTYVPLDPSYPAERLDLIVSDARATTLITNRRLHRALFGAMTESGAAPDSRRATRGQPTVIDIERPLPEGSCPPPRRPTPANLAYIIYTSGSTGRPRGVAVEHRSVVNALHSHLDLCSFDESDVWSQFAAAGFDMALYEQLMPLLTGARSVICPEEVKLDGRLFVDFVNRHGVTVLVSAPTFLRSLGQPDLPAVRYLLTGGEAAHLPDVRHYARTMKYLNCYGPTETTICVTTYVGDGAETGTRLPVGRPLANAKLYILDERQRPVPVGVPGEVYIGGIGLARGYWNDPDLTRERFVPVPSVGAERLYRTGDRARWLPDGTVDFLGRLNNQVKLRGYRVELEEIETVLTGHPAVEQAIALMHEEALVAFVLSSAGGPVDPAELRDHLRERLPGFMVPGVILPVDQMPMTEHAKIDRRALARLAATGAGRDRAVPEPRTATEKRVAGLWRAVLDATEVGPGDDFFALGGHSLLIVRLLDRIEAEFGVGIGVREFLTDPTVGGVSALIDGMATRALDTVDEADSHLDPALRFPPAWAPWTGSPRAVLLTGATGFVGAFLLRELLRRTDAYVHCLVRAPSAAAGRRRIAEAAAAYRIDIEPDDPRVVACAGDLGAPGLAIGPAVRARLAGEVDMIVHAGAHVHHLSSYTRLKPANVDGTHALLRLAAEGIPKRFHYVSTLSVFADEIDRVVTEETPTARERHSTGMGYSASKWVADRMVAHAAARGGACHIYRIGRVSGETAGGAANVDDMFYRLLMSCAALRAFPDDAGLRTNLLPVDVVARAIVELALNNGERLVHHLHHSDGVALADFRRGFDRLFGARGAESAAVPLAEWVARARNSTREVPILPYLPALADAKDGHLEHHLTTYQNAATRDELARLGVPIPAIDTAMIERYWRYLEKGGFLW